jgi:hypothetical protein
MPLNLHLNANIKLINLQEREGWVCEKYQQRCTKGGTKRSEKERLKPLGLRGIAGASGWYGRKR